jgi:protein TonB
MNRTIFSFLLVLAAAPAALAQQPAPAQQIIVLQPGHMQVKAHPDANRPDRAPVYPGGELALGLFFLDQVKYPEAARVKQLSGSVLVTATVNADGTVTDPVVAKSLSPECDAEALRVVPLMTGWQPAMRRGHPLAMLIQLPVPFGGAGDIKVEQNRPQPKPKRK